MYNQPTTYFHGDLILNSCEGYGTDAIVYLKTKEAEAMELLPVYNKTSTKQYRYSVGRIPMKETFLDLQRKGNDSCTNSLI